MDTIYAVIWVDFASPLTLRKDSAANAIEAAQAMWDKSKQSLQHLRAVELTPANELKTLWEPERDITELRRAAYDAYYDMMEQANRVPLSFHAWQLSQRD